MSGFQRFSTNLDADYDSSHWAQQFEVELVCIGHRYHRDEEIEFCSVSVPVPALHEWLSKARGVAFRPSGEHRAPAVIYEAFDSIHFDLADDLNMIVGDTYDSKKVSPLITEIEHGAVVSLRSGNVRKPLEEWLYLATGVVGLFSFLMERPIPLEPITGMVGNHPINVHHGWWNDLGKPADYQSKSHFEFVRYEDVRDALGAIARKWISLYATHGHMVRDYLHAATGLSRFATDHLLTFVRVAEYIHKLDFEQCQCRGRRRQGKRWSLRERLVCLSDSFAHVLGERGAREAMANRIKSTRNSMVHLNDMSTVLAYIDRMAGPYEAIRGLVTLHFLRLLGIDENLSEVVIRRKLPNALHYWRGGQ